ncbi:lazarillo protein-like [Aedes albopictus]|uniref:Lipocalin/cytosolic fatty-acid binding domain-containing protein n=1 Tax=Aedes albopictus TaxID=7160 RepID=A0ABM1YFP1_AEDAL
MRTVVFFSVACSVFLSKIDGLDVQGPCRNLAVENQFKVDQYMGTWYEVKRYENENQPSGDCVTAQYTLNSTSMEVAVENTMKLLPNQSPLVAYGQAVLASATSTEAKLLVRFNSTPESTPSSNYWVLKTDYQQYAIVWSCHANGENSTESAWVLSRNPVMNAESKTIVESLINQYLKQESFRDTKQGDEFCSSATMVKISNILLLVYVLLSLAKF